jgi:16S rRNA (guanine966-N2)-methyltransferase
MRIVAGEYRGRSLRAPPGRSTRPTADRVREALFSILGPAAVIRDNLAALGASGEVVEQDALRWLRRAPSAPFGLVFVDPPYDFAADLGVTLSQRLPPVLAADARTVTESDKRNPLTLDLPLLDERTYGDTRIAIHGA